MKINKRKISKRRAIIVTLLLTVIFGAAAFYYVRLNDGSSNLSGDKLPGINYDSPSDDQKKAGDEIKKQSIEDSTKQTSESNQNIDSPSAAKKNVSLSITSIDTQNSSTAAIRVAINAVVSTGTCTLVLTKDSTTITKTSSVQASANISGCGTFDISGMAKGVWSASISFENDSLIGSTTQKVTLQ